MVPCLFFGSRCVSSFVTGSQLLAQDSSPRIAARLAAFERRRAAAASPVQEPEAQTTDEEDEEEEKEEEDLENQKAGTVPQLFPLYLVHNRSDIKKLAAIVTGHFRGLGQTQSEVVDVKTMGQTDEVKGKLLYLLAYIPEELRAGMVVLPRMKDRKFRVRIFRDYHPLLDEKPIVLVVSKTTDIQRLSDALRGKLFAGDRLQAHATAAMEFGVEQAAGVAISAIERAVRATWREMVLTAHFNVKIVNGEDGPRQRAFVRTEITLSRE